MHFDLLDDVRTDAVCTRVLTYSIRKIETQKKENLKGKIPEKLTNRNWAQRIDRKNHLIYAVNLEILVVLGDTYKIFID